MIRSPSRGDPGNLFLIGLTLFLLSCQGEKATPPVVEYASCWEVSLPGPVCTRWPSEEPGLKLWVKHEPGEEVEIRAGDRRLVAEGVRVDGGSFFKISIPEDASRITVSLLSPDGRRNPDWSLQLGPRPPAWQYSETTLKDPGKLERLRRTVPPQERGRILRALAFTESDQGRKEDLLQRGIAADHAEKNLLGESEKISWLARLYLEQGRFSEARQLLSNVELPPEAPAEARYWIAFYQGVLAQRTGDYRTALEHIRSAVDITRRVGLSYRFDVEQVLANVYQGLGLSEKAAELFERLRAEADSKKKTSCEFGDLLINHAWSQLLARQSGEDFGDPTPTLEEAKNIYDNGCEAGKRLNARLNLAFAHLQGRRPRQARQALDEARPFISRADLEKHLWRLDIEGRILMVENQPEQALHRFEELAETAERFSSLDGHFRAFLGRAQALRALGHRAEAIHSLAQADNLLDQQIWRIPVHEGRDTFLAQKGTEATRRYLALLLEDGQTGRAFEVARRSRSRLLRQLVLRDRLARLSPEERALWEQALSRYQTLRNDIDRQLAEKWRIFKDEQKTAGDRWSSQLAQAQRELDRAVSGLGNIAGGTRGELSPPGPGEVILLYHPLPEGWVGFAADESRIEVDRFELPGGALLAPFRSVIKAANRVRVLPYGHLWGVDFEALLFDGQPLLHSHTVAYSLDLPPPPPAKPAERVALLVADPRDDLPEARKEAERVSEAIRGWNPAWSLERLNSLDATAEAARDRLPAAHLLHYAGHGFFQGDAGWDSVLELADDSTLTVGDVLALRPAPDWVVLSACDGARSSEQAPGTGVGLAQAFLVAGSRGVVAAHRPVPDSTARELMRALYERWRPGAGLAQELRRAQLAYLQRHPDSDDWASFRLLTP